MVDFCNIYTMANTRRAPSPPLPPDPAEDPLPTRKGQGVDTTQGAAPTRPTQNSKVIPRELPGSQSAALRQIQHAAQKPQPIHDAMRGTLEQSQVPNLDDPSSVQPLFEQFMAYLRAQQQEQQLQQQPVVDNAPARSAGQLRDQFPAPPLPAQPHARLPDQDATSPAQYTPPGSDFFQGGRGGRGYSLSSHETSTSFGSGTSLSRESKESMRSDNGAGATDASYRMQGDARKRQDTQREQDATRDTVTDGIGLPRRTTDSSSETTVRSVAPRRRNDSGRTEILYEDGAAAQTTGDRSKMGLDREKTLMEKTWQPLFEKGSPSVRLGQFLRGIALHLIEEYEPVNSLVVTPDKMLRFFQESNVAEEFYPWHEIFGGRMRSASVATMYRKLNCPHHLVQSTEQEAPTVPALTPTGFESFMTILIQAHPDQESIRLAKAVMKLPISNADNKAERFPKELPRSLLPDAGDEQAELRLLSSLNHEPGIFGDLRRASTMPPPPPPQRPLRPPGLSALAEGKRVSNNSGQKPSLLDDEDLATPFPPIERERKPYFGKGEGLGKNYEPGQPQTYQSQPPADETRRNVRQGRTQSNSGVSPPRDPLDVYHDNSFGTSAPVNIPRQSHRMSTSQVPPPISTNRMWRDEHSPPQSWNNRRSEPFITGSMPAQPVSTRLHPSASNPVPVPHDRSTRRRHRRGSRGDSTSNAGGEDFRPDAHSNTGRSHPIPVRTAPPRNHYNNSDAGSIGGNGVPAGSYPAQRPPYPDTKENRRRSMYAAPQVSFASASTSGGTEGYGSFSDSPATGKGKSYGNGQQAYDSQPRR